MMRPIGREFRELSPERTDVKPCPARIPAISLVVVPLFPISKVPEGAASPCMPFPLTRKRSPFFSMASPICLPVR